MGHRGSEINRSGLAHGGLRPVLLQTPSMIGCITSRPRNYLEGARHIKTPLPRSWCTCTPEEFELGAFFLDRLSKAEAVGFGSGCFIAHPAHQRQHSMVLSPGSQFYRGARYRGSRSCQLSRVDGAQGAKEMWVERLRSMDAEFERMPTTPSITDGDYGCNSRL